MKSRLFLKVFIAICLSAILALTFTACKDKEIFAESSDFESYPDDWNNFNDTGDMVIPEANMQPSGGSAGNDTTNSDDPTANFTEEEDEDDNIFKEPDNDNDGIPDDKDDDDDNDDIPDDEDDDANGNGTPDKEEISNNGPFVAF